MWNDAKALQDYIVRVRRDLHRIPELGFDLPQTSAYVAAELDKMNIPYKRNTGDSGIIATIVGGKPGKTVALRTDMDALPIREETGFEFSSTNENMHACGHDAHIAMLLGAAKVLKAHQNELNGSVRLLFQTNEESVLGAKVIIENGGIVDVDAIFAMHVGPIFTSLEGKGVKPGSFVVLPSACMASTDKFVIKVKGAGCHGSSPEKSIDPFNIAAHIVISLQAIIARETHAYTPIVLSIGKISGGNAYNIIPDEVVIEGTTRFFDAATRKRVNDRIGEISAAVAATFRGTAETEIVPGPPPLVNNTDMATLAADAVKAVVGDELTITSVPHPHPGAEDFAYYMERVPGAWMCLYSNNAEKDICSFLHTSTFNVDEDILWEGSAAYVSIVDKFLNC